MVNIAQILIPSHNNIYQSSEPHTFTDTHNHKSSYILYPNRLHSPILTTSHIFTASNPQHSPIITTFPQLHTFIHPHNLKSSHIPQPHAFSHPSFSNPYILYIYPSWQSYAFVIFTNLSLEPNILVSSKPHFTLPTSLITSSSSFSETPQTYT